MKIQLRLYKRFDADLLSLSGQGFSVPLLAKAALDMYAKGKPLHFRLPQAYAYDTTDVHTMHVQISITDPDTKALLKQIKPNMRNAFTKALLRDALTTIPLGVFFADKARLEKETDRISELDLSYISIYPDMEMKDYRQILLNETKPLSSYTGRREQAPSSAPVASSKVGDYAKNMLSQVPPAESEELFGTSEQALPADARSVSKNKDKRGRFTKKTAPLPPESLAQEMPEPTAPASRFMTSKDAPNVFGTPVIPDETFDYGAEAESVSSEEDTPMSGDDLLAMFQAMM